jgi:hypothetical protein
VQKYIVDKGWPDAGIYDIDGSIADLGAIPLIGQTPTTEILIKPIDPVMISGTTAKTRFSVYSIAGNITNPRSNISDGLRMLSSRLMLSVMVVIQYRI